MTIRADMRAEYGRLMQVAPAPRRARWRMGPGVLHALAADSGVKEVPTRFLDLPIEQTNDFKGWELQHGEG